MSTEKTPEETPRRIPDNFAKVASRRIKELEAKVKELEDQLASQFQPKAISEEKDKTIEALQNRIRILEKLIPKENPITTYDGDEISLPHKEEREWIPVTERLPEEDEEVLMCCPFYKLVAIAEYRRKVFIYKGSRYRTNQEVTHWQPLPPPPQQN
jgi:hypothetical protein